MSEKRSVRFEDEDDAYSAEEYRAISSTGSSVPEWELSNRRAAAAEEIDSYWEQQNVKKTVRELGKGVRADLQKTITRKGGDNRAQAGATAEIYREMGGSPEPEGNRNRWKTRDLQRTAINEHMAKQRIESTCEDRRRGESSNEQRQINDRIIKAAKEGARAGESLQSDSETGVKTNGWFGFLFGSHAEREYRAEESETKQLSLEDQREWTFGDIARTVFLGGRDEKLFDD